jgi:hypothetical protein
MSTLSLEAAALINGPRLWRRRPSFMMFSYLLEKTGARPVLAFATGCALSSSYGFLSGAWPFGAVEAIWTYRHPSLVPRPW